MNLPDAHIVGTETIKHCYDLLADVIDVRGMACLHGGAGLGKSFSTTASLRELAPDSTLRIQFRSRPHPADIRRELFAALKLPGPEPTKPFAFDQLLKHELRSPFRVLMCDEAQQLSRESFEYWRYLWDDKKTDISVLFVGGGDCYKVLSREPMLASRIYAWQKFTPMGDTEVLATIPSFHPLWASADPEDILYADRIAAHGNFRAWANLTWHCLRGLLRLEHDRVDRDLLKWAFSRMRH
jgi:hypothetical protein